MNLRLLKIFILFTFIFQLTNVTANTSWDFESLYNILYRNPISVNLRYEPVDQYWHEVDLPSDISKASIKKLRLFLDYFIKTKKVDEIVSFISALKDGQLELILKHYSIANESFLQFLVNIVESKALDKYNAILSQYLAWYIETTDFSISMENINHEDNHITYYRVAEALASIAISGKITIQSYKKILGKINNRSMEEVALLLEIIKASPEIPQSVYNELVRLSVSYTSVQVSTVETRKSYQRWTSSWKPKGGNILRGLVISIWEGDAYDKVYETGFYTEKKKVFTNNNEETDKVRFLIKRVLADVNVISDENYNNNIQRTNSTFDCSSALI